MQNVFLNSAVLSGICLLAQLYSAKTGLKSWEIFLRAFAGFIQKQQSLRS